METKIQISLTDAEQLANDSLQKLGYDERQSRLISHHLIDSELRGLGSLVWPAFSR